MSGRNYKAMGDKKLRACYEDLANQPVEDRGTIVAYAKDRAAANPEKWAGVRFENAAVVPKLQAPAPALKKVPLPMLCHTLDTIEGEPLLPDAGDWVMEPKLDGNRLIAHVREDGQTVDLYGGRNGTLWTESALDPIRSMLRAYCPGDTIVDGELMVPMTHARSSDVSHAVASGGTMELWVFDVLRHVGADVMALPWHVRRGILESMFDNSVLVKMTPVVEPSLELARKWIELGLEGVVCKHKEAPYQVGKRSHNVLKWKPQETLEGRIIGFVEGKNGNAGNIGALKIRIEDSGVETTVSCPPELSNQILLDAGLSQFEPTFLSQSAWLGLCMEFKHYGLFPSGSPRHPGFVRMRPDRD